MSSDANASTVEIPSIEHADQTEAAALKGFIAIVALVVVAAVVLGLTFGLAGIGALAIAGAAGMLIVTVLLTRG